jgi:hypothetical protein
MKTIFRSVSSAARSRRAGLSPRARRRTVAASHNTFSQMMIKLGFASQELKRARARCGAR